MVILIFRFVRNVENIRTSKVLTSTSFNTTLTAILTTHSHHNIFIRLSGIKSAKHLLKWNSDSYSELANILFFIFNSQIIPLIEQCDSWKYKYIDKHRSKERLGM